MTPRFRVALVAALAGLGACSRPAPPQQAETPATPPADTAPPATVVPAPVAVTPGPAPATRDSAPPAARPPRPPTQAPAPRPTPAPPAAVDTTPPPPLRDAYHQAPRDTVDGRTYQGWKYYNLHCARCHGEDVNGTTIAPHLIASLKPDGPIPDEPAFLQVVCAGRPEKGMPAWCALELLPGQIDTIYAYVKGRSDGVLHPGRPARRAE